MISEGWLNECLEYLESDFWVTSGINTVMIEIGKDADVIIRNELEDRKTGVSTAINEAFLAGNNDKLQRILKRLELALKNIAHVKEVPISHIKPAIITSHVEGAKKTIIQMLINQIEGLIASDQPATEPKLKWNGSKIDLIKIIDILFEMGKFSKPSGGNIDKIEVMNLFGNFLGEDLKAYDTPLSQAYKEGKNVDTLLKVFNDMLNKAEEKRNKLY
jgi:hypothetical protein